MAAPAAAPADADPATARYARVVVDSRLPQLDRLFEYRVPPGLEGVVPGVRVRVPLRGDRQATGYVVEVADARAWEGEVADVDTLLSPVPVLRPPSRIVDDSRVPVACSAGTRPKRRPVAREMPSVKSSTGPFRPI